MRGLMLDRASVHRSTCFEEARARWFTQGLQVKHLPSNSPELNLIELLWQAIIVSLVAVLCEPACAPRGPGGDPAGHWNQLSHNF